MAASTQPTLQPLQAAEDQPAWAAAPVPEAVVAAEPAKIDENKKRLDSCELQALFILSLPLTGSAE